MDSSTTNPWEQRRELGFFPALIETVKKVLTQPDEFYSTLKVEGPYTTPFLYYFCICVFTVAVHVIYGLLFPNVAVVKLPPDPSAAKVGLFVVSQLFGSVFIFLGVAIIHFFVKLFGGKGDYKATFFVMAYAVSGGVLDAVPLIGTILGAIWAIVIGIKGLKHVHQMPTRNAALAYLLLPIVCMIGMYIYLAMGGKIPSS